MTGIRHTLSMVSNTFHHAGLNLIGTTGMTTIEHALPIPQLYDDIILLYALSGTGSTPTHIVNYGGAWGEQYVWATEDIPNDPKFVCSPRVTVIGLSLLLDCVVSLRTLSWRACLNRWRDQRIVSCEIATDFLAAHKFSKHMLSTILQSRLPGWFTTV